MENYFVIQDDLILAVTTRTQHDEALEKVCAKTMEVGMTLNPDKCLIAKKEYSMVEYDSVRKRFIPRPQGCISCKADVATED